MADEVIVNDLAMRYATPQMRAIHSPRTRVVTERQFWVAVLKEQKRLGVVIPEGAIEAYERVIDQVDLDSIAQREVATGHDVKARIDEFCALAGFQVIHLAMTSRDLTENVEQLLIRQSLELVRDKCVAILAALAHAAEQYALLPMVGRSHNVPAQVTTLGKRLASTAEEMLLAFYDLEHFLETYRLRGLKGPVGTAQDQLDLVEGDGEKLDGLEWSVAAYLGFRQIFNSVGQIYPRSLDYGAVSCLVRLAAAPASFGTTFRLMAGYGLVSEPEREETGSSAMPHKRNARLLERVIGLKKILGGCVEMVGSLSGDQWQEGDVSCSVVRRQAIPNAFYAMDGLAENFLTVILGFAAHPEAMQAELDYFLPFLFTTKVLLALVKQGMGREEAHQLIREHALAALAYTRVGGGANDLFRRLAEDPRVPLDRPQLDMLASQPAQLLGDAEFQIGRVCQEVAAVTRRYRNAATYQPQPVL